MTSWKTVFEHFERLKHTRISDHFEVKDRAENFCARRGAFYFDYAKVNMDVAARAALFDFARAQGVEEKRNAMFSGERLNETEDRAVLHTALRRQSALEFEGEDIVKTSQDMRLRMAEFAESIRAGRLMGAGGSITDVINIGIGGSDLGPHMAVRALKPYHDGPNIHFLSNIDAAHFEDIFGDLDPRRCLVLVASKTFTTMETMLNAQTARDWMVRGGGDPLRQFAAISSALDETAAFGIPDARVFGFENWVGGRYSIWGPIGLSLMVAIGSKRFEMFISGARDMDQHFRDAPMDENIPILHALVGVWHRQVAGYATRAVLPYDQRLELLPAYLQQLEMESNGKTVTMQGEPLDIASGPIVWGSAGTNGQHAYYQMIHQGSDIIPCEFMVAAKGHEASMTAHHDVLVANCFAQSESLMMGRNIEATRQHLAARGVPEDVLKRQLKHRVFEGNRPSVTFLYPQLTPFVLGQLIALYEHRVFVEGVMLGINSFDQWGVELGKELAVDVLADLNADVLDSKKRDGSTTALLRECSDLRKP
ncbi:MAG: glucose-6-phosphate isomerase [Halocynthiibacter sp.]